MNLMLSGPPKGWSVWFWNTFLDGFAGGIVGGLIAAVAIVVTLRHERQLAQQAADLATSQADKERRHALAMDALPRAREAAHVVTSNLAPVRRIFDVGGEPLDEADGVNSLFDSIIDFQNVALPHWPKAGIDVTSVREARGRAALTDEERARVIKDLDDIAFALLSWESDPADFE